MDSHTVSAQEELSRAAQALVRESAVDMSTETGHIVEVWTISSSGEMVRASAAGRSVRMGTRLECRLLIDETPHRITAVVAEETASPSSRAALVLRVAGSSAEAVKRRSEHAGLYVPTVVTAVDCERVPPDEPLSAVITDLSEDGLAISVADTRPRENDRLRLRLRVFDGLIDCELSVRSVRPAAKPGNGVLDCAFAGCSEATAAIIRRWIDRVAESDSPSGTLDVRAALGIRPEAHPEPTTAHSAPPRLRAAWQL